MPVTAKFCGSRHRNPQYMNSSKVALATVAAAVARSTASDTKDMACTFLTTFKELLVAKIPW